MRYDQDNLREMVRSRMAGKEDQPTPLLVRQYAESHDLTKNTVKWLKVLVIQFGKFLGRDPVDADFTPASVNAWLTALLDGARLSRITVKSYRRGLLILWNWLYEEDRAPPALKVKRVKAPWPVPVAFTAEEVSRLVSTAASMTGNYPRTRIPRGPLIAAIVQTAWDTGLRPCDLFRLKMSDFNAQGQGAIVQHKTSQTVLISLRPSTLEAIFATGPEHRQLIFGGVVSKKGFYKTFRKLVEAAGVPKGSIYKIRKGAASALECEHPGFSGRFLGHRTPGLAERHYHDPRIVNADRRMPPALPPALPKGTEGGKEAAHA